MTDLNTQDETIGDAQEHANVKNLVMAIEELDDLVIALSREAIQDQKGPVTEQNLRELESLRKYCLGSNYAMADMLEYLKNKPNYIRNWIAASTTIVKAVTATPSSKRDAWYYQKRLIQRAGARSWPLAVPCSKTWATGRGTEALNALIDKLAFLDGFIFAIKEPAQVTTNFAGELRDTLQAIQEIQQKSGNSPYTPHPTEDQITEMKIEIRKRRFAKNPPAVTAFTTPHAPLSSNVPGGHSSNPVEQPEGHDAQTPVASASEQSTSNWNPTITAFVTFFTMASAVPGFLGWQYSPHEPGTIKDSNFWFLLQGSLMQVLGLLIITLSILPNPRLPTQPRFWTWCFMGASLLCSLSATPLYLFYATEWSATMAFLGSAAQTFVILQAMFVVKQAPVQRLKTE